MQPVKLLLALLLCALPASASYVNSGNSGFNSTGSNTCTITGVSAGNIIYVAALFNSSTSVTISSSQVAGGFTQDGHNVAAPTNQYLWHGIATSSGTVTITDALVSGSTFNGSACAAYTFSHFDLTAQASVTTTASSSDIVATFLCGGGPASCVQSGGTGTFTTRQQVISSGQNYLTLADATGVGSGTYGPTATAATQASLLDSSSAATATSTARHQLFYR